MDLWFVTPAYQRYHLTSICLAQRKHAIAQLAEHGINAHCVVVADDDNIDIARELDFDVVEVPNDWLGKKFNDGYEYAAKQGADFVFPVGSDSWVDARWVVNHLAVDRIVGSRFYTMMRNDGLERNTLFVPFRQGVHYVVPTALMKKFNYRPVRDDIMRGCDNSFYSCLYPVKVVYNEVHALESVAFQSLDNQITSYERIYKRWGTETTNDPFTELFMWYPDHLVHGIQAYYSKTILEAIA